MLVHLILFIIVLLQAPIIFLGRKSCKDVDSKIVQKQINVDLKPEIDFKVVELPEKVTPIHCAEVVAKLSVNLLQEFQELEQDLITTKEDRDEFQVRRTVLVQERKRLIKLAKDSQQRKEPNVL